MNNQGANILLYSDKLAMFEYGKSHPFKPERARQLMELLNRYNLIFESNQKIIEPEPLAEELLYTFHGKEYINLLRQCSTGKFEPAMLEAGLGTSDNPVIKGIYEFALQAAGATWQGTQMLLNNEARFAFNPVGGFHHGGKDHAEGFCYVNDIALAITECLKKGCRVAYIDIDVHHGNGIQDAFYGNKNVLTISLHESGRSLYPGSGFENETGINEGLGYTVNIPLLKGSDDEVYLYAFESLVPQLVTNYKPHIVFAEIGGDTHIEDPLANLALTSNSYKEVIGIINKISPKIMATGGGGYNPSKTAALWTLAWAAFCGIEPEDHFAGSIGGMMYGPETDSGNLDDAPYYAPKVEKDRTLHHAENIVAAIRDTVFPIHGLDPLT